VAAAFCAFAPMAQAGALDQDVAPLANRGSTITSDRSIAQTFTAGRSGVLDRVDLWLSHLDPATQPIHVEIRNVSGGAPGATVLGSATVPGSALPPFKPGLPVTAIPLTTPVAVTAGTQYAIVIYTDSSIQYTWVFAASPYAGGASWYNTAIPPSGPWSFLPPDDLAFTTYVAGCAASTAGTAGPDTLIGTDGSNSFDGKGGDDFIDGQAGQDCLSGSGGSDTVAGGDGIDSLSGGAGGDILSGGGAGDAIDGGDGGDQIEGGGGSDTLVGGAGTDTILGDAGNDVISAADGQRDTVDCGSGASDSATVDGKDSVSNCENVTVAP
jgi:Ca2+-binding RTX toxin-like protein